MTEKYSFFDPVEDENGQFDREYNAQEFTDYFGSLITTGVMKGAGNQLSVSADGSSMVTKLNTGVAFVEDKYYANDSLLNHTHDTETVGKSRIDRIVIRKDLNTEARHVKSFVKKGVASASPVAPTLTQTPNVYEISVAQVKVVGGQTFISAGNVTDERGTKDICPWAGSKILPNFDDVALTDLVERVNTGLVDATTFRKGIVKLNDTITSVSTTEAVTARVANFLNGKMSGDLVTGAFNLGDASTAAGPQATAFGCQAFAERYATAFGNNAKSKGVSSTTLGNNSSAEAVESMAIGITSYAKYKRDIAIGPETRARGGHCIAIGNAATAGANYDGGGSAIAIGTQSTAEGVDAIAIGPSTTATTHYTTAIGRSAVAINEHDFVLGGPASRIKIPGHFSVTGTKNFEMPHPHPNKKHTHVIRHGAVESPSAGDTLYRYEIEAMEDGQIVEMQLPDYFKYLNTNVDVWVNPHLHFGRAFGIVEGDILKVTCEKAGVYKALVIGTRNDDHESVQTWGIKGVEREVGESWTGETHSFEVDEILEVEEIKNTEVVV